MNEEKQKVPTTDFERNALENEVTQDHKEANRAARIARRLVGKTTKLIDRGKAGESFFSPTFQSSDSKSTTLALNAELKQRGIDARAAVRRDYSGKYGDHDGTNVVVLKEVDGVKVDRKK